MIRYNDKLFKYSNIAIIRGDDFKLGNLGKKDYINTIIVNMRTIRDKATIIPYSETYYREDDKHITLGFVSKNNKHKPMCEILVVIDTDTDEYHIIAGADSKSNNDNIEYSMVIFMILALKTLGEELYEELYKDGPEKIDLDNLTNQISNSDNKEIKTLYEGIVKTINENPIILSKDFKFFSNEIGVSFVNIEKDLVLFDLGEIDLTISLNSKAPVINYESELNDDVDEDSIINTLTLIQYYLDKATGTSKRIPRIFTFDHSLGDSNKKNKLLDASEYVDLLTVFRIVSDYYLMEEDETAKITDKIRKNLEANNIEASMASDAYDLSQVNKSIAVYNLIIRNNKTNFYSLVEFRAEIDSKSNTQKLIINGYLYTIDTAGDLQLVNRTKEESLAFIMDNLRKFIKSIGKLIPENNTSRSKYDYNNYIIYNTVKKPKKVLN